MNAPSAAAVERAQFSKRLIHALSQAQMKPTPTALARSFNLVHASDQVTVHAVRKWLLGDSIPTQEKLRTLAEMLGVTLEWLRFGGDKQSAPGKRMPIAHLELLGGIAKLNCGDQALVGDFVRMLVERDRAGAPS